MKPSSAVPSAKPSCVPSTKPSSAVPSVRPTAVPTTVPSSAVPSTKPSAFPTNIPSAIPTSSPTSLPTHLPTAIPSSTEPSESPTVFPTFEPSESPTPVPSSFYPTLSPTNYTKPNSEVATAMSGGEIAGIVLTVLSFAAGIIAIIYFRPDLVNRFVSSLSGKASGFYTAAAQTGVDQENPLQKGQGRGGASIDEPTYHL